MLCYNEPSLEQAIKEVLILIVMEYALLRHMILYFSFDMYVLILIVMEYALLQN